MQKESNASHMIFLLTVGIAGWFAPGAGYFLIKEKKRGVIVFITIMVTFLIGLYIGSIGVINPINAMPWYIAQILTSPVVAILGHISTIDKLLIYGRANDFGQIYTGIAGLLNLLGIVNAVYLGHVKAMGEEK
jgi:hypothetical protein